MFQHIHIRPQLQPLFMLVLKWYLLILNQMLFLAWANVVRTQYLLPHKHDKQYILSIVSGAIINVILNCLLIPKYQAAGALIATLFAEGIVCMVQSLDAARHINMIRCLVENMYFICSGITMLIVIRIMESQLIMSGGIVRLGILIGAGASVYLALMAVYYFVQTKILKKKISVR